MQTETLFLLVGKSGSGKDTMADLLQKEYGLKKVKSVSTRAPRFAGENTYYFISDDEYDAANLCQHANFSGCRYGATVEEVDSSSLFVICPDGMPELMERYRHRPMVVLYFDSTDETRYARMMARGDSAANIAARLANDAKAFENMPDGITIHTIDANQDRASVFRDTVAIIQNYEPFLETWGQDR